MSAVIAKLLRECKARIADPAKWCIGVVDECECALSAVYQAHDDFSYEEGAVDAAAGALNQAAIEMYPKMDLDNENLFDLQPAATVNDTYGHGAVMRMYDLAIESEEGLS